MENRRGKLALLVIPFAALLLGGCGKSATNAQAALTPSPGAGATPWIAITGGTPGTQPTPNVSYSSPTPFPTGFLPLGSASATPAPAPTGTDCANIKFHVGMINGATVVAGTTSATVSWYNPGGAELVEYRLTAISQNLASGSQRDVGWTVVKPGSGCGMMSAPVTGLDPQTYYIFSVDAVFTKIGEDGTYASTIARSISTRTG